METYPTAKAMNQLDKLNLRSLPLAARILLTAFLFLIGAGYLAALGNLYHRHELADGRQGLTFDDLVAHFQGLSTEQTPTDDDTARPGVPRSRMLQQIQPGGDMRKELINGGEPAVRALTGWLERGAQEHEFATTDLVGPRHPSALQVIQRHCLRCHNADNGEKKDAPFGPDIFDADYQMVWRYAAPGTALRTAAAGQPGQTGNEADAASRIGPQSMGNLLLVSHIHMLAMPVYTLILGGLVLLTSLPRGVRGPLAVTPMIALVCDFTCWWLARVFAPAVYLIPAAGAVYGAAIAVQLGCIVAAFWLRRRRPA